MRVGTPPSSSAPTARTASSRGGRARRRDRPRVALEGNVPGHCSRRYADARPPGSSSVSAGGYGWVFPKGDHANLGVGGWWTKARLRRHLDRLARATASTRGARRPYGARLPMRVSGTPAARGRVLLVGDAAGWSTRCPATGLRGVRTRAARRVRRRRRIDPRNTSALSRPISTDTPSSSWKAKRAADRHPRACLWALRAPGVFGTVAGLLRGDLSHPSQARRLARPPLRVLSRLARAAPE